MEMLIVYFFNRSIGPIFCSSDMQSRRGTRIRHLTCGDLSVDEEVAGRSPGEGHAAGWLGHTGCTTGEQVRHFGRRDPRADH